MSAAAPLVIGVGNPERGDDGAGLRVARLVRALLAPRVRVLECDGSATALLAAWDGAEDVVIVDAMRSGAAAGTVRRFEASRERLPAESFRGSTHGFGVAEAVELGRALGRLPRTLVVYGIEGRHFGLERRFSAEVALGIRDAAQAIAEELAGRLAGAGREAAGGPALHDPPRP